MLPSLLRNADSVRRWALSQSLRAPLTEAEAWERAIARGLIAESFYDPELRFVRLANSKIGGEGSRAVRSLCVDPQGVLTAEALIREMTTPYAEGRPIRFEWLVGSERTRSFIGTGVASRSEREANPSNFMLRYGAMYKLVQCLVTQTEPYDPIDVRAVGVFQLGYTWQHVRAYDSKLDPLSWQGAWVVTLLCPDSSLGAAGFLAAMSVGMLGRTHRRNPRKSQFDATSLNLKHVRELFHARSLIVLLSEWPTLARTISLELARIGVQWPVLPINPSKDVREYVEAFYFCEPSCRPEVRAGR